MQVSLILDYAAILTSQYAPTAGYSHVSSTTQLSMTELVCNTFGSHSFICVFSRTGIPLRRFPENQYYYPARAAPKSLRSSSDTGLNSR